MPFTVAHPAIILPLTRWAGFSVTAMIAGSMIPDFEFFFQMREVENIGHHWYGIVLFDVPAALLLCYLFHNLLRNLFIAHLPAVIKKRFAFAASFNWNLYVRHNKITVLLSLLTGIASHMLLDAFTHYDGFFVIHFPALAASTNWLQAPVYTVLQILFSIIGLAVIFFYVYKIPGQKIVAPKSTYKLYWPLHIGLISLILLVRITLWPQYNTFGGLAIAFMGSVSYGWLFASLFIKYFYSTKPSL